MLVRLMGLFCRRVHRETSSITYVESKTCNQHVEDLEKDGSFIRLKQELMQEMDKRAGPLSKNIKDYLQQHRDQSRLMLRELIGLTYSCEVKDTLACVISERLFKEIEIFVVQSGFVRDEWVQALQNSLSFYIAPVDATLLFDVCPELRPLVFDDFSYDRKNLKP